MIRYYLQRIGCTALSLLVGASLVLLSVGVTLVGFFQSEKYIQGYLENNKAEIIATADESLKVLGKITALDEEAYVGTINDSNFYIISTNVAKNLVYGYSTDFSDNQELYDAFSKHITAYVQGRDETIQSSELVSDASLAVDYVSEALNANDTAWVGIYRFAREQTAMYLVVGSLIGLVVSFVSLELINRGRHRKFNYMGMGITIGGYILVAVPLFARYKGYISQFKFLEYKPYNDAVSSAVSSMLNVYLVVGVIAIIGGFVILIINYNYYRKKQIRVKVSKAINEQLKNDFLEDIPSSAPHRLDNNEFQREIIPIDFEK